MSKPIRVPRALKKGMTVEQLEAASYMESRLNILVRDAAAHLVDDINKFLATNPSEIVKGGDWGAAKSILVAGLMEQIRQYGPPYSRPEIKAAKPDAYARRNLKRIREIYEEI